MTTGTLKEKATGTQGMFDLQSPSTKHRDTGNINDDQDTQREITDRDTGTQMTTGTKMTTGTQGI